MCSDGAAIAATPGRGNRFSATDNEYQVVLPSLPTGRLVLNTVFLHADVSARPYKVEDFRDALAQRSILPEVIALGAYRMSHVWAVTLKDAESTKMLVNTGELQVKGKRCIVIDPANRDIRMKVHWLLHSVPDEDLRLALAPFGKVTDVVRERWRAEGVADKVSTTRVVTLKMNAGVKIDDLPHQLSVSGELALVVVPGRAPLCLRCRGTGHICRECRIPRCGVCRRFGHEDRQCQRTYASVTAPGSSEDSTDLLIDEADSEEAASPTSAREGAPSTSSSPPPGQPEKQPLAASVREPKDAPARAAVATSARKASTSEPVPQASVTQPADECMDTTQGSASAAAGKRPHEQTTSSEPQLDDGGGDEPPTKAPGVRRFPFKPRPNIPCEPRRSAANPPP
ncbi:uncharacterized protein LOC125756684 [Rhipicephalus sanguineus]|uniref:uncharacterized protein LOC125756684 n=1 Tax=Rhipicephalus sanguineus TaxID=34632 RepID=UPI0020C31462|nr:uncharacterized protein LOC125756684 [Rhipicephalus sanguineus]